MIRTHSLTEHPSFLKAQQLVRAELCRAFEAEWSAVLDLLASGKSLDMREDFELMVELENCIVDLMSEFDLPGVKSVQFPANVRVSHAAPPAEYLSRPFATDYVHCDVWSNAPADSLNVFLYLFTYGNCSRLRLFESIESDPVAKGYRGPYSEFKRDMSALQEVPQPVGAGIMHVFSTYCPHQTVRGSDGVRISIDLRIRTEVPYLIQNVRMEEAAFCSYSPGLPGTGIYWTKPQSKLASFAEKCAFEMAQASALGPWAASLRESYIRKITTTGVFA